MQALRKVIYATASSVAAMRAVYGRVFWDSAPEDTKEPYLVMRVMPSMAPLYDTSMETVDTIVVRFSGFFNGHGQAEDFNTAVESTFVNASMAMDAGRVLDVSRAGRDVMEDPDRNPDGSVVFQSIVDMVFTVQRQTGQ